MTTLSQFRDVLMATSESAIHADPSLGGALRIAESGSITIDYAPFEHIEPNARLVIVGITPGAQQSKNALAEARRALLAGKSAAEAIKTAKVYASFSGPMRSNLIAMLDHIGVPRVLGVSSTTELWSKRSELMHFTSALRYPVYVDRKNYAGNPSMTRDKALSAILSTYLTEEAHALPNAIWVPLGPAASEGVGSLVRRGILSPANVVVGLPHPSGANAERIAYFLGRKSRSDLSSKTSAIKIDKAREKIISQIEALNHRSA
jgi:hypothetical protein